MLPKRDFNPAEHPNMAVPDAYAPYVRSCVRLGTYESPDRVTKEFFEQYKTLFLDLKDKLDDITTNNMVISAEFTAKKISATFETKD